jgi:hypothetical protein
MERGYNKYQECSSDTGLGLWCLTLLLTIIWCRKPEYPEKTTDNLSHRVVSSRPRLSGFQTHNPVIHNYNFIKRNKILLQAPNINI